VGFVPDHDAEIMVRFKRAGLIILGKTNTPEGGLLGVTESVLRGPARNPWQPEHVPGGSSGGSASAVASRMVPLAHGGDGGGSIRIPASACGLFGLKPTRARNPLGPDDGEGWNGQVVSHVLTRSVRDSAAVLDAVSGADRGAPYVAPPSPRPFLEEVGAPPGKLKIAFTTASLFGKSVHPDCVAAVEDAVTLLQDLGHEVSEAKPEYDKEALIRAYFIVVSAGTAAFVAKAAKVTRRRVRRQEFEPVTWFLAQLGRTLSALELEQARATMHQAGRSLAPFFERYDLLLTSTLAYPPVKVGELALTPVQRLGLALMRAVPARKLLVAALDALAPPAFEPMPNTQLFNQTGQPAVSVPLYWNAAGLPIGVQLVARFGGEAMLLRIGAQLETARPWTTRRPQVI